MDKRALIGIALSILVLVAYQQFVNYYYGPPPEAPKPVAVKSEPEKTAPPAVSPPAPSVAPAPAKQTAPVDLAVARSAKEVRVETDNYVAVFTTLGARLKSFQLKHYRSLVDEKSPPFDIVTSAPGVPLPLGIRWQGATPADDGAVVIACKAAI